MASRATVYLDGVPQKYCFYADDEAGEAVIAMVDKNGRFIVTGPPEYGLHYMTVYGNVWIDIDIKNKNDLRLYNYFKGKQ